MEKSTSLQSIKFNNVACWINKYQISTSVLLVSIRGRDIIDNTFFFFFFNLKDLNVTSSQRETLSLDFSSFHGGFFCQVACWSSTGQNGRWRREMYPAPCLTWGTSCSKTKTFRTVIAGIQSSGFAGLGREASPVYLEVLDLVEASEQWNRPVEEGGGGAVCRDAFH